MQALAGVEGAVTAVTGFEKGSGKTTFLGLALPHARRAGPVAIFTIGSSDQCAMPSWADEGVLLEAVTPASQQAIFAAPDQTLTTLEF